MIDEMHSRRCHFAADWDNLFATLLAANGAPSTGEAVDASSSPYGGFGFAVSNLFQVVKSKTAAGFVPNFAAGGMRSQDRTEPPIGAKVTLNLVNKFGADRMGWVVDALFDDLLDWNDWFIRKRLKPPLNMVALGTFNDQNHQAGNMQVNLSPLVPPPPPPPPPLFWTTSTHHPRRHCPLHPTRFPILRNLPGFDAFSDQTSVMRPSHSPPPFYLCRSRRRTHMVARADGLALAGARSLPCRCLPLPRSPPSPPCHGHRTPGTRAALTTVQCTTALSSTPLTVARSTSRVVG